MKMIIKEVHPESSLFGSAEGKEVELSRPIDLSDIIYINGVMYGYEGSDMIAAQLYIVGELYPSYFLGVRLEEAEYL